MGFLGWIILGVLFSLGIVKLMSWAKDNDYKIKWYEILLMVLGAVAIVFALEAYSGSQQEFETTAATMSLVFLGIPGLILIGAGVGLVYKNINKSGQQDIGSAQQDSTEVEA